MLGRKLVRRLAIKASCEPLDSLYKTADKLGWLAWQALPGKRRLALANLRIAFPAKGERWRKEVAKGAFRNLAANMMEFLRLPYLSEAELKEIVRLEGEERLQEALAEGGAIYYTGHFGNWELMGARLTAAGYPLCVIARELHDPIMSKLVASYRQQARLTVLEGKSAARLSLEALRQGKLLGILNDQDAGSTAPMVPFFGRAAATAPGPVVLAARTGAKIVPAFCVREESNRHTAHILPAIAMSRQEAHEMGVAAGLQTLNCLLEDWIRAYPHLWLWLHNRWRTAERRGPEPMGAAAAQQGT